MPDVGEAGLVPGPNLSDAKGAQDKNAKIAKFMANMRRQFRLASSAESECRADQLDDRRFRASEQWFEDDMADRERENQVVLTVNRIPQFLAQVTNQARAAKAGITVVPRTSANIDAAAILQGYIRDIELASDADTAYITAAELQAEIGLGYIRVITEYDDQDPAAWFKQRLRIKRVRNRFMIYVDPLFQEFDGSDFRFAFEIEDLPPEEYYDRFKNITTPSSLDDFQSIGDQRPDWMPNGSIRVARYWYVEEKRERVVLLKMLNGEEQAVRKSDVNLDVLLGLGAEIINQRDMTVKVVRHCVVDGIRILDDADEDGTQGKLWPGHCIPLVPVIGYQIDLEGRVDYRGMVRDAKDPQRMYNYWLSATTETVALAPKAPWVMAEGQDENYEEQWDNANIRKYSRLVYTPVSAGGQLAPPPQRQAVEPPIMAMTALIRQADNDLKAVMGFHDASLGERGPAESGKAILARQKQGEIGNSHFLDNLAMAIRQVGRILLGVIPSLHDKPELIRTVAEDGSVEMVYHYPGTMPPDQPLPEGVTKVVDLRKGVFDVQATVGPSFISQRREAVAQMGELLQKSPSLAQALGDLWVGNMDAPWAKEAAERLKKMVPPELLEGEDGEEAKIPPQAMQQIQQAMQQVQMLGMQMQVITQERDQLAQKVASKEVESAAKIEIEKIRADMDLRITEMKQASDMQMASLDRQLKVSLQAMKAQESRAPQPPQAPKQLTAPTKPQRPRRRPTQG